VAVGQQAVNNDDIKASLRSCGVIRKVLDARARQAIRSVPTNDDYTPPDRLAMV